MANFSPKLTILSVFVAFMLIASLTPVVEHAQSQSKSKQRLPAGCILDTYFNGGLIECEKAPPLIFDLLVLPESEMELAIIQP